MSFDENSSSIDIQDRCQGTIRKSLIILESDMRVHGGEHQLCSSAKLCHWTAVPVMHIQQI